MLRETFGDHLAAADRRLEEIDVLVGILSAKIHREQAELQWLKRGLFSEDGIEAAPARQPRAAAPGDIGADLL